MRKSQFESNDTSKNSSEHTLSSENRKPSSSTPLDNIGLSGVSASNFLSPFDSAANNQSNDSVNENTGKPIIRKYPFPYVLVFGLL